MLNNGICENECHNEKCYWDMQDCLQDLCSEDCSVLWVDDGVCDTKCMNP